MIWYKSEKVQEIIKIVAEKNNVSENQVLDILDSLFCSIKFDRNIICYKIMAFGKIVHTKFSNY